MPTAETAIGSARDGTTGPEPGESRKERLDRELQELLEETRVILPGVEILFGFLIILPFQFADDATDLERLLYSGALICVSGAFALLVAPTIHHRTGFRSVDKEHLILLANRLALAASVLLGIAIALAVYLAVERMIGGSIAGTFAAANAAWFTGLWFAMQRASRRT